MPVKKNDLEDFSIHQKKMVETQIQSRGVSDPVVLNAMLTVPRHEFVPEFYQRYAYDDSPLPIGRGQTISQPYIVAFMTEALKCKSSMKILEIGTGSGYQTAILSRIVKEVYTIEIVSELSLEAAVTLGRLGYKNVHFSHRDGYEGWPEHKPYDGIIVTAAPDHIPEPLIDQLVVGGTMIIPVGTFIQELILIKKMERGVFKESILPVRFVPMIGIAQQKSP